MLAAGVAHEINNPLIYVLYNLESLMRDLPEVTLGMRRCYDAFSRRVGESEVHRLLGLWDDICSPFTLSDLVLRVEQALEGTERIKEITRGLGAFTRVDKADECDVNLNTAMESAINMAYNEIKYRARLVKDLAKIPVVRAPEGRLAQVFLNLLINATHAMEAGDVERNSIHVRTYSEGTNVYAEVKDTGSGIKPEDLGRLFEPFFTTKAKGAGTGLGLYISNNIIKELGGEIVVASELGKGTRFTVRIPKSTHIDPHSEVPASVFERQSSVHGRVLVVDDEALVRDTISRMLSRYHDVVTADSGEAGRTLLKNDRRFDAVICDLIMPELSGMELYQWLLGEDKKLAEQMIFITGGAFTEKAKSFLRGIGNQCLDKPFRSDSIVEAVRNAIAHEEPDAWIEQGTSHS
jgi:CheY-like chemotaxis protein